MDNETYTLLLGAGITLFTTLFTTLLAYIVQSVRETKQRNWQIEDNQRNELIAVRKKRLNDVESVLEVVMKMVNITLDNEEELLKKIEEIQTPNVVKFMKLYSKGKNNQSKIVKTLTKHKLDKSEITKAASKIKKLFNEHSKRIPIMNKELKNSIEKIHPLFIDIDNKVNEETTNLLDIVANELRDYHRILKTFDNLIPIDVENENTRIRKTKTELRRIRSEIISAVDRAIIFAKINN
ncbi:MAG TPA: hypothetical protein DIW23_00940 [Anaerolineae bacterium]|nr:hypothetical protein [Anaerolineae bacterium]